MMPPATKARVRRRPGLRRSVRATSPLAFLISVEVTKTMAASGMRITAIVLNWRLRYADAPSWIALAISIIFGVPWSWARTSFIRTKPTARASRAEMPDSERIAHSPPFSTNSW